MDTKELSFLFIFISFVPLIYKVFEESHVLHKDYTFSYYIGDREPRYAYFTFYFALASLCMLLFEYLTYKQIDFRIFLLMFSSLSLLWIPEQEHFFTHVFFAVIAFATVMLYMIQTSMKHKHYVYSALSWINIIMLIYILLFFQIANVVNAEMIFIVLYLVFYWFHHKNTFQ